MNSKYDIGIYGLGIMGQNLAINLESHGYDVLVTNRMDAGEDSFVDSFISKRCQGKKIRGVSCVENFVTSLKVPRKIIILVKAGKAVDDILAKIVPLLTTNDIVIDGGNSHYTDTATRLHYLHSQGLLYVGCGISGGEDGALNGPSMMPGGSFQAWEQIQPIFQKIAAKSQNGDSCCNWIGPDGSGHFVKMVHNGIEYALMQILAEAFDIMKRLLSMSTLEISTILQQWNKEELHCFLLDITCRLLGINDTNGLPLIENIRDCAEQKGTGKDIAIAALEFGVPVSAISESINARYISCMINERHSLSRKYSIPSRFSGNRQSVLHSLYDAVYCSQLVAYAQGFMLLAKASSESGWDLNLEKIARIWTNGCIIRSTMLDEIATALQKTDQNNILHERHFMQNISNKQAQWREVNAIAIQYGIPVPVLSSTLSYFDGLCSEYLPANLIQAQRDYFGAHGFERLDAPREVMFSSKKDEKKHETL